MKIPGIKSSAELGGKIKTDPDLLLAVLLGLWWALNVVQGAFTGLANDEAYYWFISRDLAPGYFDHPSMFALLTWLGVNIFGDNEIGVRFFTILLQPLYLYLFWTLVRTSRSTWRSALRYFLIAFSIPLLQLYGFVDTPDTPLMMSVAVTLWAYKRFVGSRDEAGLNWPTALNILLLGAGFALMAYSKYHGALVFALLALSNLKLLKDLRFWLACLVALALVVPHLVWQWQHDFVSFNYHLTLRNRGFEWGNLFDYLMNLLLVFNPLLIFIFMGFLFRRPAKDDLLGRGIHFIALGFIIFFLLQTFRGYVQPQWLIPAVFTELLILTRECDVRRHLSRYVTKVGLVSAVLFLAVRIFAMTYEGGKVRLEIFGNEESYGALAEQLDGRPMIFDGSYTAASKLNYYTKDPARAWARPSIYSRSSQYEMIDMDTRLYGEKVAVELADPIEHNHTLKPMLDSLYFHAKAGRKSFYYDTVDFYIPTRYVEISYDQIPGKLLTGQELPLVLEVYNPYNFSIPVGGSEGFSIIMQLRHGRFIYHQIDLPLKNLTELPPRTSISVRTSMKIPDVETNIYKLGFSLQRYPFGSWYNSRRMDIQIVNPKNRI